MTREDTNRGSAWAGLAIACLVILTCSSFLQAAELSIPSLKAQPGTRFIVPVTLTDGGGISALHFRLLLEGGQITLPDTKPPIPGTLFKDHTASLSWYSDRAHVVVFSSSLSTLQPGTGPLVYVVLQLGANVAPGTVLQIPIVGIQGSDQEGNVVAVTARAGSVTATSQVDPPAAGANELIFPQIANGTFPGGSYMSTLVFVNRTAALVSAQVKFFRSNGSAFSLKLADGRQGSQFPFTVPDGGSVFLQTDGSGPLDVGYAVLTANGPLGGTILFSQRDAGGRALLEAGVGATVAGTRFSIPVLYKKGIVDTGVAFANSAQQGAEVALTLRDATGGEVEVGTPVQLAPGQHSPKFASELFPALKSRQDFAGVIEVQASNPVSAVALKLQGLILTTFPVIPTLYSASPEIEVTPPSLNFGSVFTGSTKPLTFAVRNKGTGALTVQSITKTAAVYSISAPAVPFTVEAGAEQQVTVVFAPTGAGVVSDTLTIASNDSNHPTVTLAVTGTGNPGTAPTIVDVTVTEQPNYALKTDVQFSDPDGDIVKLEFFWWVGSRVSKTTVLNSPGEINISGQTSGTVSYIFTNMAADTPYGKVMPGKVEVQATDARGLKSTLYVEDY